MFFVKDFNISLQKKPAAKRSAPL